MILLLFGVTGPWQMRYLKPTASFQVALFLRLILTMKAVGIPKFGPSPSRLYFLGGTMRFGLVRRCWLINFIVAILANNPPKYALE